MTAGPQARRSRGAARGGLHISCKPRDVRLATRLVGRAAPRLFFGAAIATARQTRGAPQKEP